MFKKDFVHCPTRLKYISDYRSNSKYVTIEHFEYGKWYYLPSDNSSIENAEKWSIESLLSKESKNYFYSVETAEAKKLFKLFRALSKEG